MLYSLAHALLVFLLGVAQPFRVSAGQEVVLDESLLRPIEPAGGYIADVHPPSPDPARPIVDPKAKDPGAILLRRIAGKAAGFDGILYDNRDRDHSPVPAELFPRLTRLEYAPTLRQAGLDYGLAGDFLFPGIVLGNSSTASTGGKAPRSQVRLAMTRDGGPARAWRGYVGNALYVYPEHRDHDDFDRYPANWPYTVTSQGSSHSDQPFIRALLMTAAAFPPETRARLEAEGLVAPTLQMILRRSMRPILSREAYLSPAAHPPVFEGRDVVSGRMVGMAASLTPDAIPPLVRIGVTAETFSAETGTEQLSERLFDTPSAVARIWRAADYGKEMTVSAARTFDPNGRPLSFHWILLRGDPGHVRIEPFGADDAQARIRMTWHDPATGRPPGTPPGARIDIAVIASNGIHDSAPAFVSILLPLHEGRVYAAGPDGGMRLVRTEPVADTYRDPVLFPAGTGVDKRLPAGQTKTDDAPGSSAQASP